MQGPKVTEKPPGDAPPSAPSLGAPSGSPSPSLPGQPAGKKKGPEFEEYHVLAPGKSLQCAAGLVKGGEEVTAAGLGQARFDRLKEAGTIIVKKRRIK